MMMRNSYVEVDLAAVRANMMAVRGRVGGDVSVIAVVKANGYGHGAVEVSRTLLEAGADMLAVALPAEGAELRLAGVTCPILVMGSMLGREVPLALEHDLMLTIFGESQQACERRNHLLTTSSDRVRRRWPRRDSGRSAPRSPGRCRPRQQPP